MVVREQQNNFRPRDVSFLIPENNSLGLSAGRVLDYRILPWNYERKDSLSFRIHQLSTNPTPTFACGGSSTTPNSARAQVSGGPVNSSAA
jgi:hypothetical protein